VSEIEHKVDKQNLAVFSKEIAVLYGFIALVLFGVMRIFLTVRFESLLSQAAMPMTVVTCRYCLGSSATFRWAACGIVSLMTALLALVLILFGFAWREAILELAVLTVAMTGVVWLCTFLLRKKAVQLRRTP